MPAVEGFCGFEPTRDVRGQWGARGLTGVCRSTGSRIVSSCVLKPVGDLRRRRLDVAPRHKRGCSVMSRRGHTRRM